MKNKLHFRFGLRTKLLLLSSFLFAIPWFGYQYVWEMEKYLRFGQEQTIIGTARALATSLHERPNLFNNQASFLPDVEKGKDLYGYQLSQAINLDGLPNDWPNFQEKAHYYGVNNQLGQQLSVNKLTNHFSAAVGKYDKYLYFFIQVVDDTVIYRDENARAINKNDHLELSFNDVDGNFQRFIVSNKNQGWLAAYRINDLESNERLQFPRPVSFIQGQWRDTEQGYNIELRIPLTKISDRLAFAIHDVDAPLSAATTIIGSADPSSAATLGTILVPSPEIERIVKGMSYTQSRIWVVDQHHRVLAKSGDIKKASGLWQKNINNSDNDGSWYAWIQKYLQPLFQHLLNKPQDDFIDRLYDTQNLTGEHIEAALAGTPKSQWRLTTDKKAVIISAAYPIYISDKVNGAVIVEETTNGILSVRNKALEKLFTSILAIMLLGAFAFFFFASRISNRIRQLRNQAEIAIDEHGRINNDIAESMQVSTANDEIGDLSRSFSTAVNRLSQYNHYLENMSSRLSHELRTPIAIVRTSLENLSLQALPENSSAYIDRAQSGISRLNNILTNMSEATRLEQMLNQTDKVSFNVFDVLNGCVQGYQQIYPNFAIEYLASDKKVMLAGSPEHIAQLLDKVVTNAVEFSEDNKLFITTALKNKDITIHVSNNGTLLPETMEERLFDSMVSMRKTPQIKEDKTPHLGLGLYIARLICEFHQGHIMASNHHNPQGVTVSITLPLQVK
ncbi:proteobacterial dedicated sortase system histidine kinase [Colwellia hornerae]|uniref:histidine kinase n=1 Tax=Colwellia hornerae TaxID=89402 RepID=A0A5C6QMQ8_9GAMM|nr:proteobacterial dedicated sortase system histidine kinase [Colwellia hornerae]TWX53667.1 proteobacterial dedicated sortase system histidine kinase [Colwellia hornerae]TWX60317.1 proteobacterial dedicated sortase system histidine kinase [Colwellia hornerae]TWX70073.1 proteobacterial dedicated sortase system histidine kinase [Colwellia hornerae]